MGMALLMKMIYSLFRYILGFLCGLIFSIVSLALFPFSIVSWIIGTTLSSPFPRSSVVSDMKVCGVKGMRLPWHIFLCCIGCEDDKPPHTEDKQVRSLPGISDSSITTPPHVTIQMHNAPSKFQSKIKLEMSKPAARSNGSFTSNFTYEELKAACNNFSDENLLGEGGFARVYKGKLSDGREVAIKHIKATSTLSISTFQEEAKIVGHVHHRHLVVLIGCCISERKWILVYEYVPNQNLSFHLHENEESVLDWPKRFKISVGAAKGLAYLHEDCLPRVIHRDVKADNILLDNSFEAKVADFGIAKNIADDKTHVSTRLMGTFGYMDPEYASSGQLTEKTDVFSFGVVLLELITGLKPIGLVDWARPLLAKALEDNNYASIADLRLANKYNLEDMRKMVACANACIQHSAALRPHMSQIVRTLGGSRLNNGGALERFS